MKTYRETVVSEILKSKSDFELKTIIDNAFEKLKSNGTHPFIILRFKERMKADLMNTKSKSTSLQEKNIASHALNELDSYEVGNTKNEKLEKH
jgi:hypothetical protein